MKCFYNKKTTILTAMMVVIGLNIVILNSCTVSQKIMAKSGAQLWSENCQRCHNTPSPSTYSPEKWETIGLHMQSRALLTEREKEKIVAFLKQ